MTQQGYITEELPQLPNASDPSAVLAHRCPLAVADIIQVRKHIVMKRLVAMGIRQPVVKRLAMMETELLDITINHLLPERARAIDTQQALRVMFFSSADDPLAVYDAVMQVASTNLVNQVSALLQIAGADVATPGTTSADAIIHLDELLNSTRHLLLDRLVLWADGAPVYLSKLPKENTNATQQ